MSLLDGGRKSTLPSMSWRSVVDDDPGDAADTADAGGADGSAEADPAEHDAALRALRLDVPMFELDDDDATEVRRTFGLRRSLEATPGAAEPEAEPVPEIREATPVTPLDLPEAVDAGSETPVDLAEAAEATPAAGVVTSEHSTTPPPPPPVVGAAGPAAPVVPAGPVVPVVPAAAPAAPTALPPHPFATPPAPASGRPARPSRRRRGLGLVVVLVVLAGLIAAGIVFGRDYLFPDGWDDVAGPYAEAIEDVRGSDFVEPLTVVAVPPMEYQEQMAEQLLGTWEQELPMWRSFGLANGELDPEALHGLVTEREPALYSVDDGQVHHDSTLVGDELDAWTTYAMSVAALDQDHGWTIRQDGRTLDDAALTAASVRRQAVDIQSATEYGAPLGVTDDQALAFLPPVLGYRVLAPEVFAELLPSTDPGAENPLADLGTGGPGPIGDEALVLGPDPLPAASPAATILAEPIAKESSFWYLVFAGYLDAPRAHRLSDLVAANSLAVVEEADTVCSLVSFTGEDDAATAELGAGLEAWVGAAPAELRASVASIDGGVLLRTCDPGVGFEVGARLGVARELVGWRATELATAVGIASSGGSRIDLDAAFERLAESDAGRIVAALANDTSSEGVADAARAAVADVVDPPLAPLAEG